MELSEILNYSITILAVLASIVAWIAKLKWSKEFKEAKEAEIKAKVAQIETIKEKLELYESIVSKKLIEHSKQTIQELENLLSQTEKSKQAEINRILDDYKKSEDNLKQKYTDDNNIPLLAILSHELRTPINGIIGFSELTNVENISDDKRKKYKEIIESNAMRLLSVLDDLMDLIISQQKIYKRVE